MNTENILRYDFMQFFNDHFGKPDLLDSSFSDNYEKEELYHAASDICDILKVEMPEIYVLPSWGNYKYFADGEFLYNTDDTLIYITVSQCYRYNLAHELYHLYQFTSLGFDEYHKLNRNEEQREIFEIEATGFAVACSEKKGYKMPEKISHDLFSKETDSHRTINKKMPRLVRAFANKCKKKFF